MTEAGKPAVEVLEECRASGTRVEGTGQAIGSRPFPLHFHPERAEAQSP